MSISQPPCEVLDGMITPPKRTKLKKRKVSEKLKIVEFKFTSAATYLLDNDLLQGVLHVPMVQDERTGKYRLPSGCGAVEFSAGAKYDHTDQNGGKSKGKFDADRAKDLNFIGTMNADSGVLNLGVRLQWCVGPGDGEEGEICTNLVFDDEDTEYMDADSSMPWTYSSFTSDGHHLDSWIEHQGGMLVCTANTDICDRYCDADVYAMNGTKTDAAYKLKLYTVLSVHAPNKIGPTQPPRGYRPDWTFLEEVMLARFPDKNVPWARRAVAQYRYFLDLKIAAGDWNSMLYTPSRWIDETWHAHISFLERYRRDVLYLSEGAGRVIEHSPVLGSTARDRYADAFRVHMARMGALGEAVDHEFWPAPASDYHRAYDEMHVGDSDECLELLSDSGPGCG